VQPVPPVDGRITRRASAPGLTLRTLAKTGATPTSLHLSPDGALSRTARGEGGVDTYEVDWLHASNYGAKGSNRWLLMTAPDDLMLRGTLDQSALVYETDALRLGGRAA